jgi:cytochrome c oxidase subunit 4
MTETASAPRLYFIVFAALLVLLALTVGVAMLDFGPVNIVVALAVAAAKTVLIALYFMHLQTAPTTVRVFAAAGAMWLVMLLVLLLADYFTRPPVPGPTFSVTDPTWRPTSHN